MLDRKGRPKLYAAIENFIYAPGLQISQDFGKTWQPIAHCPQYSMDSEDKANQIWTPVQALRIN